MKKFLFGKAWHAAAFVIILWALVSFGLFYYSTEMTTKLLPFIICFLFVYPIGTFAACFWYGKHYGKTLFFQIPIFLITICQYFFFGFDSVEPNYFVMTLIAVLFGCNIGSLFCENITDSIIEEKIKAKQKAKEKAEKEYKSIIDDK